MVPLAIGPPRPQYVDLNPFFVEADEMRRFTDRKAWSSAIFAHLQHKPELLMVRLWQCVEANHEGRTPPSLDDLVAPPTPLIKTLKFQIASATFVVVTCVALVLQCF